MGSGLAKVIKENYHYAYLGYQELLQRHGATNCYGRAQLCIDMNNPDNHIIANIYGQFDYGSDGRLYTGMDALDNALKELRVLMDDKNYRSIAFPYKMSSVRGGADWNEVYKLIEKHFSDLTVEICRI